MNRNITCVCVQSRRYEEEVVGHNIKEPGWWLVVLCAHHQGGRRWKSGKYRVGYYTFSRQVSTSELGHFLILERVFCVVFFGWTETEKKGRLYREYIINTKYYSSGIKMFEGGNQQQKIPSVLSVSLELSAFKPTTSTTTRRTGRRLYACIGYTMIIKCIIHTIVGKETND